MRRAKQLANRGIVLSSLFLFPSLAFAESPAKPAEAKPAETKPPVDTAPANSASKVSSDQKSDEAKNDGMNQEGAKNSPEVAASAQKSVENIPPSARAGKEYSEKNIRELLQWLKVQEVNYLSRLAQVEEATKQNEPASASEDDSEVQTASDESLADEPATDKLSATEEQSEEVVSPKIPWEPQVKRAEEALKYSADLFDAKDNKISQLWLVLATEASEAASRLALAVDVEMQVKLADFERIKAKERLKKAKAFRESYVIRAGRVKYQLTELEKDFLHGDKKASSKDEKKATPVSKSKKEQH